MTCKDCIHNEVCDQSSRMMWAAMAGKTECDDFKDRSLYVVREKGEWDDSGRYKFANGGKAIRCPFCGACLNEEEYDLYVWNFCPCCGNDMRKGENG